MDAILIGNTNVPCGDTYWGTAKAVAEATVRYMRNLSGQKEFEYGDDEVPIRGVVFDQVMNSMSPQLSALAEHFGRPQAEVSEQLQLLISVKAMFRVVAGI